ncbi:hypothetical protein BZA77DRAFT_361909 [Pyronema omphalodes]|nr:hypothetical protein BZA77DRAFT_361909 [Pyronema omphalodes]
MSVSAPRETSAAEDTLKKRQGCCCCCYHYNKFDISFAVFRYFEIALGVWIIAFCVAQQYSDVRDEWDLRHPAYLRGPLIPLGAVSILSGVLISGMGCCTKQPGVRFPLNRPRLITETVLQSLILTISLMALPLTLLPAFSTTATIFSTVHQKVADFRSAATIVAVLSAYSNPLTIFSLLAFLTTSALCFALDIYILEKDRHLRREAKAGNLRLPGEFVVHGEGEEVVWWNGARWDQPQ